MSDDTVGMEYAWYVWDRMRGGNPTTAHKRYVALKAKAKCAKMYSRRYERRGVNERNKAAAKDN